MIDLARIFRKRKRSPVSEKVDGLQRVDGLHRRKEREFSAGTLREFATGEVWIEIRDTLLEKVEGYRDALEKATPDKLAYLQAAIFELRDVAALPSLMLERAEEKEGEDAPDVS